MKAYLKTRGTTRGLDYAFLGAAPPALWWSTFEQRNLVILEQPEVIAHGSDGVLGLLVSGIPSARRDIIGTPIRYTLVVDGLQDDADLALRLAATALSDEGRTRLGGELDRVFDAARVDSQLGGHPDDDGVSAAVAEVLASADWADEIPADRAAIEGTWAGPAADDAARAGFLARIADLAAGHPGCAFTSHALTTRKSLEEAAASLPESSAIIVVGGELEEVVSLGKKELATTGSKDLSTTGQRHGCLLTSAGTAIIVLLLALLLFS